MIPVDMLTVQGVKGFTNSSPLRVVVKVNVAAPVPEPAVDAVNVALLQPNFDTPRGSMKEKVGSTIAKVSPSESTAAIVNEYMMLDGAATMGFPSCKTL